MTSKKIILASASPRRKKLLEKMQLNFEVHPADIKESEISSPSPQQLVEEISEKKVKEVALQRGHKGPELIIGADTVVVYNDTVIGKPKDKWEAKQILKKLSGTCHQVLTGICVYETQLKKLSQSCVVTDVYFSALSSKEIVKYINTGEPFDKAGAYGIQGRGGIFVRKIEGSYDNVVGLPRFELRQLLKEYNVCCF